MGRDLGDRAERGLPALPQQGALRGVDGDANRADPVLASGGLHLPGLRLDARLQAVDLDEQHGRGIRRVPGVREPFDRAHDASVHHLQRRRHHTARDDRRDRRRAVVHPLEVEEHRADRRRERGEPNAGGRDDPERSLRTDDDAAEVVADRRWPLAAEPDLRAVGQHDIERQDMGAGDAVGQAMGSAGVRVHVAPDRADLLRGRVGRVREARGGERIGQIEVEHAGLDPGQPVLRPHLEDAVHLGGDDDQRVADRGGCAREPGAAAAWHHGQLVDGRDPHARRHVVGAPGEDDQPCRAFDHRRVARVEPERERIGEHHVDAEGGFQVASRRGQVAHADRLRQRCTRESRVSEPRCSVRFVSRR